MSADAIGWNAETEAEWAKDSQRWRGKVLTGRFRHWCLDWDLLPVDETCMEWPCECFRKGAING